MQPKETGLEAESSAEAIEPQENTSGEKAAVAALPRRKIRRRRANPGRVAKEGTPRPAVHLSHRTSGFIGCIGIACVLGLVAVMSVFSANSPAGAQIEQSASSQPVSAAADFEPDRIVYRFVSEDSEEQDASGDESEAAASQAAASQAAASQAAALQAAASQAAASQAAASQAAASQAAASQAAASQAAASQAAASQAAASQAAASQAAASQAAASSSQDDDEYEYVYNGEDDDAEEQEEAPRRGSSDNTPGADEDAFDEKLSYSVGGRVYKMNAYDLVCQILQNETRGVLDTEALKAHAVATYTMIKYNNKAGTAPAVALNSNVSSSVEKAVEAVLGVAVYYNGSYANTVYHSTSCGETTSSEDVWGGKLPYLVSVDSSYDKKSPYYKSSYSISSSSFAKKVRSVYGIDLDGDPSDWIEVEHDADGGYTGSVTLGGYKRSQGGSAGSAAITGRSIRERLLSYSIRSHCFDVEYNEDSDKLVFTVYGYGHGVGMSQYGAHFMSLEGYDYVEILEHYYSDVEVY